MNEHGLKEKPLQISGLDADTFKADQAGIAAANAIAKPQRLLGADGSFHLDRPGQVLDAEWHAIEDGNVGEAEPAATPHRDAHLELAAGPERGDGAAFVPHFAANEQPAMQTMGADGEDDEFADEPEQQG